MKFLVCLTVLQFAVATEYPKYGTDDVSPMKKVAVYKRAAGEWYDDEATILKTSRQVGQAARSILKVIVPDIFSRVLATHNYIWQVYGTVGFMFAVYAAYIFVSELGRLMLTLSTTELVAFGIASLYAWNALNWIQNKNAVEEQKPRITVIEENVSDAKHEISEVANEKEIQKHEKFTTPRTPLITKNSWRTVGEFLPLQTKSKFFAMHRNFGQFSRKYKDVSDKIKVKLHSEEMDWRFCEDLNAEKIITENIDVKLPYVFDTALHRAAYYTDDAKLARALIEAGVDVNARNKDGRTALHEAACPNKVLRVGRIAPFWKDEGELARVLIEAGVDVNAQDNNNWAALHDAAYANYLKIGKSLVEAGARLDLKTNSKDTPLDLATKERHKEFAKMLHKYQK